MNWKCVLIGAMVFWGASMACAQEIESKKVEFYINNLPDTNPPGIRIISPELSVDQPLITVLEQVDLIGEVEDEHVVRFVSVNAKLADLNEEGIFSTTVPLIPGINQIRIRAMDDRDNFTDKVYHIVYDPPVVTLADRILSESTYYALLIGIDQYHDPDIPDLDNPIRDAQLFYETLTRQYHFDTLHIEFLKNPTRSEIIRELDLLRGKISERDNLLIFYAGHGYWDEDAGIGYWLPADATTETTVDWFRNSTLVDYLQAIHSKHTLLITDACFAGSIFKSRSVKMDSEMVYEKIYEMPSRKAMTSGTLTEVPDQSAFIRYLIQKLNENEEIYLSSEELFSSMRKAVISNSNVVPQYGEIQNVGNEGGDFIFLKRKNPLVP